LDVPREEFVQGIRPVLATVPTQGAGRPRFHTETIRDGWEAPQHRRRCFPTINENVAQHVVLISPTPGPDVPEHVERHPEGRLAVQVWIIERANHPEIRGNVGDAESDPSTGRPEAFHPVPDLTRHGTLVSPWTEPVQELA